MCFKLYVWLYTPNLEQFKHLESTHTGAKKEDWSISQEPSSKIHLSFTDQKTRPKFTAHCEAFPPKSVEHYVFKSTISLFDCTSFKSAYGIQMILHDCTTLQKWRFAWMRFPEKRVNCIRLHWTQEKGLTCLNGSMFDFNLEVRK